MSPVPDGAPLSEDGHYWWDGTQWQPVHAAGDGASTSVKMSSVWLWFNVFIPDHKVSGLGNCFLGDDRTFDSSPGASSRVHAEVTVSGLGTSGAAMGGSNVNCGLTRRVDCGSEEVIETGTATPSGGFANFHFGNTYPDPEAGVHDTANESVAVVTLDVTASDPLVLAAPSVGVDLLITIDPVAGTVAVSGVTDHWPAFEGYASADGGSAVPLFQISPPLGSDPYSLLGARDAPVNVTVQVV